MCPYYEKQFLAQDQTKLVELWGDKERNAARKKAESLYDALFRRIVAKMQQNDLHPVTLHERHVYCKFSTKNRYSFVEAIRNCQFFVSVEMSTATNSSLDGYHFGL